eukprot:TRINITY_DN1878_c0_g1_i4.p1 TRINITY_DN1878_c0_g1~~TRINITY_DN1878_c0_g1_i4.p1  ORF type:complete len:132 (+),score=31.32 TRINITY_DN1878_c0_g1_i4:345-740(+)
MENLTFCLYSEDCEYVIDPKDGRRKSRKNLGKIWEKFPQYGPHNSVLVDDSPLKIIQKQAAIVAPTMIIGEDGGILSKLLPVIDEHFGKASSQQSGEPKKSGISIAISSASSPTLPTQSPSVLPPIKQTKK